jgi:ERO1-like protein beta
LGLLTSKRGKVADTFASYEQVEEINRVLNPVLTDILHNTDFFGYYRLNLFEAQCPRNWGDNLPLCGNRACAVSTLEEVPSFPWIYV